MKTFHVLSLFCFILFRNAEAQVNYPILDSDAVWGQFEGVVALINWQWVLVGSTYFQSSQGDTIIDAKQYIKIGYCDSMGNLTNYFGYTAFIREDSLGKVWWYDEPDDSDALLYDFNLNVGDTVAASSPYIPGNNCLIVVDSVSTVNVLGSPRKAIYFNPTSIGCGMPINGGYYGDSPLVWIEGIGSNGGLFFPTGGDIIADAAQWLTCYRENGQLAFGDVCTIALSITPLVNLNSPLEIFPNPFTTSTTITLPSQQKILSLNLFDESGREVSFTSQSSQQRDKMQLTIKRGNLVSGLYFLSIVSNEKREVVKLMIE